MDTYRLIATDLDGTLLRDDQTISDRTLRSLRRADQAGWPVVLVSARPPRFLQRLAAAFDLSHCRAICCNGALTYDLAEERILRHQVIAPDHARLVVEQLRGRIGSLGFAIERGLEFGWDTVYAAMPAAQVEPGGIEADALDLCHEPVTKLIVRHPELPPDQIAELILSITGDRLQVSYSGPHLVEIAAAGVHKAQALGQLAGDLGVRRQETVAFGDMLNDLPMLEWSGWSVAVANAHPRVLAAANEITASNTEDGVAKVVERLLDEAGI